MAGHRRCFFLSGTWSDSSVSTHFRALTAELARRGHTVVFIVDRQNSQVANHAGNPAIYTWPSRRPTGLRDALFLRKLIREYRPDCMLAAFGATNLMTTVGWWMGVPTRATWYLTLSDGIRLDSTHTRLKQAFLTTRKRFVYKLATHVIPNSAAGSEDAQRVYGVPPEKCKVMYLSMPAPEQALRDLKPVAASHRVICPGRFDPVKGQDVLVRAIPKIHQRHPEVEFEFVGDGPRRGPCEQLARDLGVADRCHFVGRVSHHDLLRRMAHSTAAVVPSRVECFGLVNVDSLAVGTPLVASDVGGIREIVRNGKEGFLIPPDDPDSLADRLSRILGDRQLRDRLSGNARDRFLSFEQSNVIEDQVDWLESLL